MRLATGDKFGWDMDMEVNMNIGGMKTDIKMNNTVDIEVMGDTADLKKLKFTTTKVKMSMDRKEWPSTLIDTNDIVDKAATKLEGKSIIILLNKNNEIVDVIGFEEKIMDAYNNNPAILELWKEMFSKDNINRSMGLMFQMYPEHPVRVGDTWEKESDISMGPLTMKMKNKFKLKEVNNGVAIIRIEDNYQGKNKLIQGSKDMDMEGKSSGEISVKINDGYLKDADYKMEFKTTAKIKKQTVEYDIHGRYLMKGH